MLPYCRRCVMVVLFRFASFRWNGHQDSVLFGGTQKGTRKRSQEKIMADGLQNSFVVYYRTTSSRSLVSIRLDEYE
jgi:hypothetical protein